MKELYFNRKKERPVSNQLKEAVRRLTRNKNTILTMYELQELGEWFTAFFLEQITQTGDSS